MSSGYRITSASVGTAGPSVNESQDTEQGFELAEMSRLREAIWSGPATTGAATDTSSAASLGTPETGKQYHFAMPHPLIPAAGRRQPQSEQASNAVDLDANSQPLTSAPGTGGEVSTDEAGQHDHSVRRSICQRHYAAISTTLVGLTWLAVDGAAYGMQLVPRDHAIQGALVVTASSLASYVAAVMFDECAAACRLGDGEEDQGPE